MRQKVDLRDVVEKDLRELAERIGPRPTGSAGNREAAAYIRERFSEGGLQVETQEFDALDWKPAGCELSAGGRPRSIEAQINPYSPPCSLRAPFDIFTSLDELEAAPPLTGRIAVLDGEFVSGQIMPKNFVFYNPEEHRKLNRLLEEKRPEAVIAVAQSGHGPGDQTAIRGSETAGQAAQAERTAPGDSEPAGPPIFADGDLKIPSITVPAREREKLRTAVGGELSLRIESETEATAGENVIARIQPGAPSKIVVVAHFDTWFDTPGAMDNAVGAAVLTGLGSLFSGGAAPRLDPAVEVELFANNGEDYYNSAGALLYLERSMTPDRTILAVNIDGIGYRGRETGLSFYGEAPDLFSGIHRVRHAYPQIVDMEPWPEGDHSIFLMQGIPAIALTTLGIHDLMHVYHHTPADRLENIDTERVAEAVEFIASIIAKATG